MKCIKSVKSGKILRVKDEVAQRKVADGEANYVPKSKWKEERSTRNGNKSTKK